MKMVSVARKLSTTEWRKKNVCFSEDITGTKVTNPKTVLGSNLSEDFEFRDFFSDIQRYVTLGITYDTTLETHEESHNITHCEADTTCLREGTRHDAGWQNDAERRGALSGRQHKIPKMSLGMASVETPIVATPTQDSKDEPRDDKR
jgi:hypothetical protein